MPLGLKLYLIATLSISVLLSPPARAQNLCWRVFSAAKTPADRLGLSANLLERLKSSTLQNPKTQAKLIYTVAFERQSLSDLEKRLRNEKGMSEADQTSLIESLRVIYRNVEEIRRAYGDFLLVPANVEARMIAKISELEARGVARARILSELKQAETSCPIR